MLAPGPSALAALVRDAIQSRRVDASTADAETAHGIGTETVGLSTVPSMARSARGGERQEAEWGGAAQHSNEQIAAQLRAMQQQLAALEQALQLRDASSKADDV